MAKVTKDDVVFDLGCGDGRVVVTAAKKYGATAAWAWTSTPSASRNHGPTSR